MPEVRKKKPTLNGDVHWMHKRMNLQRNRGHLRKLSSCQAHGNDLNCTLPRH
ncbi:hypothetical protein T4B_6868 [Trichinella pseudospiralis]|uniref:Uncharacterized protein n=1 Tax=Trichinella pseudospiralis TaxID=6337 RepID=A0A0V1IU45_TRIPS|nr:hypothetical protein T4A_2146 [Trichinella pseudospiralis]KRZ26257.1 hypothetical protein T4B_6868 [Trichinella pseudospiralis]